MPSDAQAEATIKVTLPDGANRQLAKGSTGRALASDISTSLGKKAIAVKQDGEVIDLDRELVNGASVEIVTPDSPEALELFRHDCAHVLAEAVQELFQGPRLQLVQQLRMVSITISPENSHLPQMILKQFRQR